MVPLHSLRSPGQLDMRFAHIHGMFQDRYGNYVMTLTIYGPPDLRVACFLQEAWFHNDLLPFPAPAPAPPTNTE